jgi:hypothetical protein
LRSLWGLWSFRITAGQQGVALSLAQRFYALAARRSDPIDSLIGERMIGTLGYYLGNLLSARRRLERVLARHVAPAQKQQIARLEAATSGHKRRYILPGSCGCWD